MLVVVAAVGGGVTVAEEALAATVAAPDPFIVNGKSDILVAAFSFRDRTVAGVSGGGGEGENKGKVKEGWGSE